MVQEAAGNTDGRLLKVSRTNPVLTVGEAGDRRIRSGIGDGYVCRLARMTDHWNSKRDGSRLA